MWLYNIDIKQYQRSFGKYNYFLIGDNEKPGDNEKSGRYVSCHCEFDKIDDSINYVYENTVKGYPKIIKMDDEIPGWIAKISTAGNKQSMTKRKGYKKGEVFISLKQEKWIDIAAYGYIYNGKPEIKDARYYEYLVLIYNNDRPVFIKVCPVGRPDYLLMFHGDSTDKIKAESIADYTWNTNDGRPRKKRWVNLLDLYQPNLAKLEGLTLEERKEIYNIDKYMESPFKEVWNRPAEEIKRIDRRIEQMDSNEEDNNN